MHSTAERISVWRFFLGVLCTALLGLAGCGGDKTGGPVGPPEEVVGRAPDATLAAKTAEIFITAPTANARGAIDLSGRDGRLALLAPGHPKAADVLIVAGAGYVKAVTDSAYSPVGMALPKVLPSGDPWAAIDLIRGTVHILSNGGSAIEGASTIGYTITVDPQQAIEATPESGQDAVRTVLDGRTAMFKMEVWIDSLFHLRRIEVPADFSFQSTTPPTRVDGATIGTDIDFVTFGVPVPAVMQPASLNP